MRTVVRVMWPMILAVLAPAFAAGGAHAQPAAYEATVRTDRDRIKLWEHVQVTLTVDGPAPMRAAVALPEQLLTDATNGDWRIRVKGEVGVSPLPGGRERWVRTFRLDPHAPGRPLRAEFAPVGVGGKPLDQRLAVEVTVERTGADDAPLPESLPVTTVEDPPPPPFPPPHRSPVAPTVVVTVAVGVALAVLAWRRVRRPRPLPPGEWARATLAELEADGVTGAAAAERLAGALRGYVERRFAIPAPRLTTGELYELAVARGWAAGDAQPLHELLAECDLAKFAGTAPDAGECERLIGRARDWLDRVDPPAPRA